jgi:hypothetical protein
MRAMPCPTSTSTCRNFVTISSGLCRLFAIYDPPFPNYNGVPTQWGKTTVAKLDLKKVIKNRGVILENINFGIKASTLDSFLQGNSVSYGTSPDKAMPKRQLADHFSDNTLFLSCWITMAQIEKLRAKKAMFIDLN